MSKIGELLDIVTKGESFDDIEKFEMLYTMFVERGGDIRNLNDWLKSELEDMGVKL